MSLTRSDLTGWDVSYLTDAATRWRAAADESDRLFDQYRQTVCDADWSGSAADTAYDRVSSDAQLVQSQSAIQRTAATIAEASADDQRAALQKTLDAVTEAESDGFRVDEKLSVRDGRRYDITTIQARNRAAKEHAENIQWNAQQLMQADELVGSRLQEQAAELSGTEFDSGTVQAASWGGFKQDGGDPDPWEPPVFKSEPKPHEPTVIDASPPPMFPNCDNGDVWTNIGLAFGGTVSVIGGAFATPFTFGAGVVPVVGGLAAIGAAINEIGDCT